METFAEYLLKEKDLGAKLEIVYYLSKKEQIYFNKSVVFKTELARLFLKYNKLDLDENLILTACLLCDCKKVENSRNIEKITGYAKEGAEYLSQLGFDKRFCKICEEVNRYSKSNPRERESDVLELVDQFGGMLLDRPERIGFKPDEAMVLLKYRNLKDEYNRYLEIFEEFINMLEEINMGEIMEMKALKKFVKIYNESKDLTQFIKKDINDFEPQIDNLISKKFKKIEKEMFEEKTNENRPLFTEETTRKIIGDIEERNKERGIQNV